MSYDLVLNSNSIFYDNKTEIQITLNDLIDNLDVPLISEYFTNSCNSISIEPSRAVINAVKILEAIFKKYIESTDLIQKYPDYENLTLNKLFNITKNKLGLSTKKQKSGQKDPFATGVDFSLLQIGKIRNLHSHGQIKIEGSPINQIQSRLIVNAAHTIARFILETWNKQKHSNNI